MELVELCIADEAASWQAAGFNVRIPTDGSKSFFYVDRIRISLVGTTKQRNIVGWTIAADVPNERSLSIGGLATKVVPRQAVPAPDSSVQHPNKVTRINSVVIFTSDLDGLTADFKKQLDLSPKRVREIPTGKQIFFKLGNIILEVISPAPTKVPLSSEWWGVMFSVSDIDAAHRLLGEKFARPIKAAVQPGQRIFTLNHHDLKITVNVALITEENKKTANL